MKLPQLNLRIPEQHHQLIRDIAQRLREHSGDDFAADLAQWLTGLPQPGQADPELAGRVRLLEIRVDLMGDLLADLHGFRALADPVPYRTIAP